MIDLEVRSFQSIDHVRLKIDGFTALVGKSNIGKSALVRAVKAALTGSVGNSFVRHSDSCARKLKKVKACECYCSVHIKTDGFDLLWEKGDRHNRYVFNGQEHGVPGRGMPDFLERPNLEKDFGQVKVGDQWKLLQISDQFENQFLLDQTGGVVADVLSDVARLDRVNVAIRNVEKDRKEAASTRKVREQDTVALTRQLLDYEGLDSDVAKVDRVESQLGKLAESDQKLEALQRYLRDLETVGFRVDVLEDACKTEIPDIKPVLSRHQAYEKIGRLAVSFTDRAMAVKGLLGIDTISEPTPAPVAEKFQHYIRISGWVTKLKSFQDFFGRHTGFPESTQDPTPLREVRDRFQQLHALASRYVALSSSVESLTSDLATVQAEETVLATEREAFAAYCPTCAQPIVPEHQHKKVA